MLLPSWNSYLCSAFSFCIGRWLCSSSFVCQILYWALTPGLTEAGVGRSREQGLRAVRLLVFRCCRLQARPSGVSAAAMQTEGPLVTVTALRAHSHSWSLCKGHHWGSRGCTSKANEMLFLPSWTAVSCWRLLQKVFAPFLSHHQQYQQSEGARF